MADHGRYGPDQTRDREGSRYGRGMDEGRGRGGGGGGGGRELDWGGDDNDRGWGGGNERGRDWDRDERGQNWQPVGDTSRGWGRGRDERGGRDQGWNQGRDQGGGRGDEDRSSTMIGSGRSREEGDRGDRGTRSGQGGGEGQFGYDDRHEGLPIDETSRLIASNKVEGTVVYARDGARLGSIYNFMVDKRSGKVEYVVMTYGGFLGMGTRYYPLPWEILSYDTRLGGYHVEMLERDLERAPSFDRSSEPNFDTSYGKRVRGWYGLGS